MTDHAQPQWVELATPVYVVMNSGVVKFTRLFDFTDKARR